MSDYLDSLDLSALESDVGATEDSDRRKVGGGRGNDDWFKGEKNRNYRVAFVYFHSQEQAAASALIRKQGITKSELEEGIRKYMASYAEKLGKPLDQFTIVDKTFMASPQFKTFKAYYKDGFGYAAEPKNLTAEERRFWEGALGEGRQYVTTLALFYPTDREGNPIAHAVTSDWSIKKWRFSYKQYETVYKTSQSLKANDLSLAGQDLLVTCTNDKFQQFTMVGVGKALYRRPELADKPVKFNGTEMPFQQAVLMAAAQEAGPGGKNLLPFKEMTTAQVKEKLGLTPGVAAVDTTEGEDPMALLEAMNA